MSDQAASPARGGASRLLLPLLVLVAAVIPRLSFFPGVFRADRVLPGGLDPYYHLRRIELVLQNGPLLPNVDRYANFPEGYVADWPPGFDLLMAGLYTALSPFLPATVGPAAVTSLLVPLLGALTCLGVYAVGAAAYSRRAGLAAGLLLACSAAHIDYTMVGRVDHHAVESLSFVGLLAATGWLLGRPSSRLRAGVMALGLVLAPAFWPGAIVFAAPVAAALAWRTWREGPGLRPAATFALAALLAGALSMTTPWGRSGQVVYYALSLFQPLFLGACALGLAGVSALAGLREGDRRVSPRAIGVGVGVLGLVLTAIALAIPAVRRGVFYVFQFESQISVVSESDSPFSRGMLGMLAAFTPVVLAWPLLAYRGARRSLSAKLDSTAAGLDLAAVAGLLTVGLLGFVQYRFIAFAAVPLVLLAGRAVDQGIEAALPRLPTPGSRFGAAAAALLLAGVTLLLPARPYLTPRDEPLNQLTQSLDALDWLREVAPPTGHFSAPTEQPEYSVLAGWIFGHWVTWIGEKPNVCNPLGQTDVNLRGIDRTARILFSDNEADALRLLGESGVRYLLLTPLLEQDLRSLALRLGKDTSAYAQDVSREVAVLTDEHLRTIHSQLFLGDGRGATMPDGEVLAPAERIRLAFESAATMSFNGRPLSYAKVFEVVPGAVLQGRCEPSEPVSLELDLQTNRGRPLRYARATESDGDGAYSIRVPYSTEPIARSVGAAGSYRLRCGEDEAAEVSVSAAQVAGGAAVAVRVPGDDGAR